MKELHPCDFCDELADGNDNAWRKIDESIPVRTVLTTEHFVVVPSLGPIGPAHVLVVPKRHVRGFSQLPLDLRGEAEQTVEDVVAALTEYAGDAVAFEHGAVTAPPGVSGCGIAHAHVHVVAVPPSLVLVLPDLPGGRLWKPVPARGWINALPQRADYLFFSRRRAAGLAAAVEAVPSQFMRKWLAASVGQQEWDWRKDSDHERAKTRVTATAAFLQRTRVAA